MSTVPKPENVKLYKDYTLRSFYNRGIIINETIFLERLIDDYIANHFCKTEDTKTEMKLLILCTDRITFGSKKEILQFLIETHNKETLKNHPKLFTDLTTILEQRNILAHYWLSTSQDSLDKIKINETVEYAKYKNKVSIISYDSKKIDTHLALIDKYITLFIALTKE